MSDETEKDSYAAQWRELRKRQFILALTFILYIPWMLLITFLFGDSDQIGVSAFLIWGALFITSNIRVLLWRCPRCHNSFHYRTLYSNHIARQCLHCKLPKPWLYDWKSLDPYRKDKGQSE